MGRVLYCDGGTRRNLKDQGCVTHAPADKVIINTGSVVHVPVASVGQPVAGNVAKKPASPKEGKGKKAGGLHWAPSPSAPSRGSR